MKPCRVILLALLMLSGPPACSGPDLVNALVPREGYTISRELRYGEGPRRRLDLYIPGDGPGAMPIVVFFYGGSWQSGSKDDYLFVGEAFASLGYATAIPDYRLYPEARFPDFLEDAAAAVAWVAENARTGGPAAPIYLVGHSAGAYIAAMLSLEPAWLSRAGVRVCDRIAAASASRDPTTSCR